MQLLRSHIIRGPFRRNRRNCLCNYGRCYRDTYQRYITKDGSIEFCRGCHRPGEPFRHIVSGRPPYSNVRPWNPNDEMNCFLNIEAESNRNQLEKTVAVPTATENKTVSWCAEELQNMQIKDEATQSNSNLTISYNEPSEPSALATDNVGCPTY